MFRTQIRSDHSLFSQIYQYFTPFTYMAELLYAGKNIPEKLRNARFNQKYSGVTPGHTNPTFTR